MRPREDRTKLITLISTERWVPIAEINALLGTNDMASYMIIHRLRERGLAIENLPGVGFRYFPFGVSEPVAPRRSPSVPVAIDPETFAGLLKRHRIAAGLSQCDLAERAMIDQTYISHLERGKIPSFDVCVALCVALDLAPVAQDHLMISLGYCPPSLARLDAHRLDAVLALINDGVAA